MAMRLLDTSILLRTAHPGEPELHLAREAGAILRNRGERLCVVLQNLSEFWNASTRPPSTRGGFGLTTADVDRRVRLIERTTTFLPDTDTVRRHWRQLVVAHQVQGVQVHDARLVASMLAHNVTHLLTFNTADFRRYGQIVAAHPRDVVNGNV